MNHEYRARAEQLEAEVSVRYAVKGVGHIAVEPECLCGHGAVNGICRSRERTRAERGVVHSARGVLKASEVAAEHLDICADVRRKGYRLSALKMRVARHDAVGVFFSLAVESANKSVYEPRDLRHILFEIEPYVNGNLVVSAAPGVESFARVADSRGKLAFDKSVDILGVGVYHQFARDNVISDVRESRKNFLAVLLGDYPFCGEHRCVGDAAVDILVEHAAVRFYRGVEIVGLFIGFFAEASRPELHAFASLSASRMALTFIGRPKRLMKPAESF